MFSAKAILAKLDEIIAGQHALASRLFMQGEGTMSSIDDLKARVAQETTVAGSAVALIQGLASQLADAKGDSAAIDALSAQLTASATALGNAITQNTPQATPPAPVPGPGMSVQTLNQGAVPQDPNAQPAGTPGGPGTQDTPGAAQPGASGPGGATTGGRHR